MKRALCSGLSVHRPNCQHWRRRAGHMGSVWDWERVKMLTNSHTEQGIWRVLICHTERQRGPRSREGEFYMAWQWRLGWHLLLWPQKRPPLSFHPWTEKKWGIIYSRSVKDSCWTEQASRHNAVLSCDCFLKWASVTAYDECLCAST